jgi:MarR family transcriptional regulator for hemolysin
MEKDGLLARRRDPSNRRNHIIELTAAGETAFTRLAAAALAFDQRLRTNLEPTDITTLRALLDQLSRNVDSSQGDAPWAGLIEAAADRTPRKSTRTPPRDREPHT